MNCESDDILILLSDPRNHLFCHLVCLSMTFIELWFMINTGKNREGKEKLIVKAK